MYEGKTLKGKKYRIMEKQNERKQLDYQNFAVVFKDHADMR